MNAASFESNSVEARRATQASRMNTSKELTHVTITSPKHKFTARKF